MKFKIKIESFENYVHFYFEDTYLGMLVFDKGELSDFRAIIRKNRLSVSENNLNKVMKTSLFALLNQFLKERLLMSDCLEIEKTKTKISDESAEILEKATKEIIDNKLIK